MICIVRSDISLSSRLLGQMSLVHNMLGHKQVILLIHHYRMWLATAIHCWALELPLNEFNLLLEHELVRQLLVDGCTHHWLAAYTRLIMLLWLSLIY